MDAPSSFTKALAREFPKFRIRWSPLRYRWQLEEKAGRGIADFPVDPDFAASTERTRLAWDDLIRVKDGYVLYVEVAPGTTTPCPTCRSDMKAVPFEFVQVRCKVCMAEGRHGGVVTGYFPLGETLLDVLRSNDPNRGGYERNDPQKVRAFNERRTEMSFAAKMREARACGVDDARFQIPKRGYSGKESMWLDAPAPKITLTNPDQ